MFKYFLLSYMDLNLVRLCSVGCGARTCGHHKYLSQKGSDNGSYTPRTCGLRVLRPVFESPELFWGQSGARYKCKPTI
jgi:hypothetical protein